MASFFFFFQTIYHHFICAAVFTNVKASYGGLGESVGVFAPVSQEQKPRHHLSLQSSKHKV